MTNPVSPEQLDRLSAQLATFIESQRDKYWPVGLPLSSEQRTTMSGYFATDLLANVRWLSLESESVEVPDLFVMDLDFVHPSAFTLMAAMTFQT